MEGACRPRGDNAARQCHDTTMISNILRGTKRGKAWWPDHHKAFVVQLQPTASDCHSLPTLSVDLSTLQNPVLLPARALAVARISNSRGYRHRSYDFLVPEVLWKIILCIINIVGGASTGLSIDWLVNMVLSNDIDLLHPPPEIEKRKHKLKRLVQSPNSFFMDVKCQGCFNITTVFSNSQTVVTCANCSAVLCQPTGGRARLTEGCSFRKKGE